VNPLIIAHAAVTWALVGMIWTVQLSVYRLFDSVGRRNFAGFHQRHMRAMTVIVVPLMGTEAVTAGWLLARGYHDAWLLGSLAVLGAIWGMTLGVQIPLHLKLSKGFDEQADHRLVASNWWRALAWTVRGLLVAAWLRAL
jgi:hypothetical protein